MASSPKRKKAVSFFPLRMVCPEVHWKLSLEKMCTKQVMLISVRGQDNKVSSNTPMDLRALTNVEINLF